ncbi:hypothetical protein D9757_001954 [Collybiopsis confluens]|uniref:Phosphatidic acid phosphatase type 2/haloperoxidase domain-containing protein n=1 Tax=Collybiopsis confluens TaxID=2823264 RepID=A0A8H5MEW5_9AGAR|nr:hypothetical protein D9757_001954 [Collybiopsis confluens]
MSSTSQNGLRFSISSKKRKLIYAYVPDWSIICVLTVVFYSLNEVDGFKRHFSLDDISLQYPYAFGSSNQSTYCFDRNLVMHLMNAFQHPFALYMISIVLPFALQCLINYLTIRSLWDLHNSTLGLILGLALTGSITQFVKITVGRPRPDIIDRCQPEAGSVNPTWGLLNASICTQIDPQILRDGFRSFPSGHSSLSFAGLAFLAFYLAGKLHLFDHKAHVGKAWISLSPFAGAALVAISRTMDYRHHWQDVVAGSLLGTGMAYFSYRQYYPGLANKFSHFPYGPRIQHESDYNVLPVHFSRLPSSSSHHVAASALGENSQLPLRRYADDPESTSASDLELEGRHHDVTVGRPEPESLSELWEQDEDTAS